MIRDKMENRIKLFGFCSPSESLSFNMYGACRTRSGMHTGETRRNTRRQRNEPHGKFHNLMPEARNA